MEQKRILNLKIDHEKSENSDAVLRVAKIKTEEKEIILRDAAFLRDILAWVLNPINSKEALGVLMFEGVFEDLDVLLDKGFVLKIFENEQGFKVVVTKGKCSISFEVSKKEGIVTALKQANDWAEEMIEELQPVKTIV